MIYLNEHGPNAAEWLRQLMADGLIPQGDVDERSIAEVQPTDLIGYTQCHFFAGIGGWLEALRIAGWGDRPVWTGSCPCQPFSSAGKQKGQADERHLWPEFFRLIRECRPPVVFGEQVASAIRHGWLDGVFADLEGIGYACGAANLPACGVGAPHKRERIWFVAHSTSDGRCWRESLGERGHTELGRSSSTHIMGYPSGNDMGRDTGTASTAESGRDSSRQQDGHDGIEFGHAGPTIGVGLMANTEVPRHTPQPGQRGQQLCQQQADAPTTRSGVGGGAHADNARLIEHGRPVAVQPQQQPAERRSGLGFWNRYELIPCRDGKTRRVESGIAPLVDGLPDSVVPSSDQSTPPTEEEAQASAEGRVMRLKGYGNAIVPEVAAKFIQACM